MEIKNIYTFEDEKKYFYVIILNKHHIDWAQRYNTSKREEKEQSNMTNPFHDYKKERSSIP